MRGLLRNLDYRATLWRMERRIARIEAESRFLPNPPKQPFTPEPSLPPLQSPSVIVPAFNQAVQTRRCLMSLVRHQEGPNLEIILVDNGSTDDTPSLASEFPGIRYARHVEGRGFPSSCNRGIRESTGDWKVLLNNDTIVSEGWLSGLRLALQDPRTGLIGPLSNHVAGAQKMGGDILGDRDAEAAAGRARLSQPAYQSTLFVSGFCLAARSDVLEQLGGIDESFGMGYFEDDDLSFKSLQAGYLNLIARQVFIYHEGQQTFKENATQLTSLMRNNLDLLTNRWSKEPFARHRLARHLRRFYRASVKMGDWESANRYKERFRSL